MEMVEWIKRSKNLFYAWHFCAQMALSDTRTVNTLGHFVVWVHRTRFQIIRCVLVADEDDTEVGGAIKNIRAIMHDWDVPSYMTVCKAPSTHNA